MSAIFEREFKSYFNNITGYAFIAFVLLFTGIYTMAINLHSSYPNFEYVLNNMSFIFLIIIPVLTMRVIAEERKQKTDQLLYSLPISMTKIVLGKYLAMLLVLSIPVLIMSLYPLILSMYGTVHLKTAYCAIIGFYFLGASLIAIGLFISSVTENQAVAAVLCFLAILINSYMTDLAYFIPSTSFASFISFTVIIILVGIILKLLTKNGLFAFLFALMCEAALFALKFFLPAKLEGLFPAIMEKLSLFDRFNTFIDGMFDISALVYFLTVISVFVFLTVQSLEKRRWS